MLLYGAEAWTLLSTDAAALRVFERKILRKIFGPVRVGDNCHIRFNSELYELLNDTDVVQHINIQRVYGGGCSGRRGSAEAGEEVDLVSLEGPNRGRLV